MKAYDVWSVNKGSTDSTVNLSCCEILFTFRMDALCKKDTKVYGYSMYESVCAPAQTSDDTLEVNFLENHIRCVHAHRAAFPHVL